MTLEYNILYAISRFHSEILDKIMIFISRLGDSGFIWIILALSLLFFKKTRRCGVAIMIALLIMLVTGNLVLKNIIARMRPFYIDGGVELLISPPGGYSFPSGHTYSSFAAAVTIFLYNKKGGAAALMLASLIAFSRLYLFVHFPTDIIGGILLGILTAFVARHLCQKLMGGQP